MSKAYGVNGDEFKGKIVSVAKGFDTMCQEEAMHIVLECGGIPKDSVTQDTDILIVSSAVKNEMKKNENKPGYLLKAESFGAKIIDESLFWEITGIENGTDNTANRWIIVDDYLEDGRVNTQNKVSWSGYRAPYKLFIQRWTKKTTTDGGWKVIDSGILSPKGYPVFSGQPWYKNNDEGVLKKSLMTDNDLDYRQLIGKVTVVDKYAPESCAFLFDGLTNCVDFDIRKLDTSNATSLENMFRGCTSVQYLMDMGSINTSLVESVAGMFFGCISLRVVDMLNWDLSNLKSAQSMFENSPAFALINQKTAALLNSGRINIDHMFGGGVVRGSWIKRNFI